MKAKHPITGVVYYFVDKALPFGSSRYFHYDEGAIKSSTFECSFILSGAFYFFKVLPDISEVQ